MKQDGWLKPWERRVRRVTRNAQAEARQPLGKEATLTQIISEVQ